MRKIAVKLNGIPRDHNEGCLRKQTALHVYLQDYVVSMRTYPESNSTQNNQNR